eukprot:111786-Rhodomonas_salina.2
MPSTDSVSGIGKRLLLRRRPVLTYPVRFVPGFLFRTYRVECWYYELVEIARKLVQTSCYAPSRWLLTPCHDPTPSLR